jgi:hypothetical protein
MLSALNGVQPDNASHSISLRSHRQAMLHPSSYAMRTYLSKSCRICGYDWGHIRTTLALASAAPSATVCRVHSRPSVIASPSSPDPYHHLQQHPALDLLQYEPMGLGPPASFHSASDGVPAPRAVDDRSTTHSALSPGYSQRTAGGRLPVA